MVIGVRPQGHTVMIAMNNACIVTTGDCHLSLGEMIVRGGSVPAHQAATVLNH